jgi:hypothetical protein
VEQVWPLFSPLRQDEIHLLFIERFFGKTQQQNQQTIVPAFWSTFTTTAATT